MQKKRGCKRPGSDMEQEGPPFVYGSPLLQGEADRVLTECPTGRILRDAPHVYEAVDYLSLHDGMSPLDLAAMPAWFGSMLRLYRSEKSRLHAVAERDRSSKGDARWGAEIMRQRRG